MPAATPGPDAILYNARVLTGNERQPAAELVALQGERIAWVGSNKDLPGLTSGNVNLIDCQGQCLVPGFIDAHCHILAYAGSLLDADCSPPTSVSIADIQVAIRDRALKTPAGQWVRGVGYDEFALAEMRHPTRWDLDATVPNHPLILKHRSGHACVLNTVALALVGISVDTPDPPRGLIERDPDTGVPNGLLIEMDDYLDQWIPPRGENELRRGVELASQRLVSLGITSVQDATHSNSTSRRDAFRRLKADGTLSPRVTMMVGSEYLAEFLDRGLCFGSGDHNLSLGGVKIMLSTTSGTLLPGPEELQSTVRRAQDAGFQIAIHAVEVEEVEAAADALISTRKAGSGASPHNTIRHRIEHCSECPPATLRKLERAGVTIVTQPGFLYYSGRRYLSKVGETMQPWLYPISSFLDAGLTVGAGSDAPVIDPNPLIGMYAAVSRRALTGETVVESERVSAGEALRMYTLGGAFAAFQEADRGTIETGKLADLVLLDMDPTRVDAGQVRHIKPTMTLIGGQVVWQA